MANEIWRWQHDTPSKLYSAAPLSDGCVVVAGQEEDDSGNEDFVALKLDPSDGTVLWTWKNGSSVLDEIYGAAAGSNGSVILSGHTLGNWSETSQGSADYAAVKLTSDGEVEWDLQGGSADDDYFRGVVVGQDDSVLLGGRLSDNFLLIKVDSNGDSIWEWEENSGGEDGVWEFAIAGEDDYVVLAGYTTGDWFGTNAGKKDFAVAKLTSDGDEVWRWQNGTESSDVFRSIVVAEDGSVVMSGYTSGSYANPNAGLEDAVAVKLDPDGRELWRWQNGTSGDERIFASAMGADGFVVMVGYTEGDWDSTNQGDTDFMAVKLNASDGSTEAWRWQVAGGGVPVYPSMKRVEVYDEPVPALKLVLAIFVSS